MLEKLPVISTQFSQHWRINGIRGIFSVAWSFFWMRFAGLNYGGRIATWLATWFAPPYKKRRPLARYNSQGYIAPSATIYHPNLQLGANVFIGDRVSIVAGHKSGSVELAEGVNLHNDTCLQTGDGGSIKIGADTHIQPRCQFSAYQGLIQIGSGVQIAPNCVFCLGNDQITSFEVRGQRYPHLLASHKGIISEVRGQRSEIRGKGIIVEDDVWLGHGAFIADGVRISKGAVIGSGAVVEQDIPDGAIAVGVPARVIGSR